MRDKNREEERLKQEVRKLKTIIGELTTELKKRLRGIKRKKSEKVIEQNKEILVQIREIKSEHLLWGFRRVWSYLGFQKL